MREQTIRTAAYSAIVLATIAAGVVSCTTKADSTGPSQSTVASVRITPSPVSLGEGSSTTLIAIGYDASGAAVAGKQASFSSSNTSVATISAGGLLTGVAAGTAIITATIDNAHGTDDVTVTGALPVARVEVSPSQFTLDRGGTAALQVTAYDAQDHVIAGKTASFTSGNASVATVANNGTVTAVAIGSTSVTASVDGMTATSNASIVAPPSGNVIQLMPTVTYQTIVAWQALSGIGEDNCNATAYSNYQGPLLDSAVAQLGLNGVALLIPSGMENPTDYYAQYLAGGHAESFLNQYFYTGVNDNNDPNVADPNGFHWTYIDSKIDKIVNPLRQRLAARGEHLFVRAQFEDHSAVRPFEHMKAPEEYAELVTEAFKHIQSKYGWVPDVLDVMNEPDYGSYNYNATQVAAAGAAAIARLRASGFTNVMVAGPSSNDMSRSPTYYDAMLQIPSLAPYVQYLTYHRYNGTTGVAYQAIRDLFIPGRTGTMMTEYLNATYNDLWLDLRDEYSSGWMQFGLAACSGTTDPASLGIYFQINQSNPASPIISFTNNAKFFRQVFLYVRAGAVRIRAATGNVNAVDALAFRNTNGKYVVVVRSNGGAVNFTVRGLPAGTYGITYTTSSAYAVSVSDMTVASGADLATSMPATGLMTIFMK